MAFNGTEAVSDQANSDVTATTSQWTADETGIDQIELAHSRRALANLRTLLYGRPMWDLLEDQISASERQFQEWYAASDGEYYGEEVKLTIPGITTDQFFEALMQTLGPAMLPEGDEKRAGVIGGVFPAHPEHYTLALEGAGGVETMGGMPTLTFPAYVGDDEVPDFIAPLIDPSYEVSKVGRGLLRDNTVQSYVLQQLRNVDGNVEASLRIWYPAAAPKSVVHEHLEHYTIEFRNGARMAKAMLAEAAALDTDETGDDIGTETAADGIDGTWHIEGSMGPAKREFDLELRTVGNDATGTLSAPDGRVIELTGGKVSGDTVVFKANLGMKVTFTLNFAGGTLTGKMKAGVMPATQVSGARL